MTDPEIVELQPQPTAAIRVIQPMAELDLASAFDRGIPQVASRIAAAGGSAIGAPYGRYHRFGPDVVDVEVGFPVAAPLDLPALADCAVGEVGRSELPGGPVARTMHVGPYDGLSRTYDALHEWIHGQPGYDDGPGPWESYIDDARSVTDRANLRTEIVWPLTRD
jgi:effector-binding domain-containing protein